MSKTIKIVPIHFLSISVFVRRRFIDQAPLAIMLPRQSVLMIGG
jgi:hypothetical protein